MKTPRKWGILDTTELMNMWIHRNWQHAQGLHRAKPDGIPMLTEVDTRPPALAQKLSPIDNLLWSKTCLFPMEEFHWVSKPHLRTSSVTSSRVNTKELSGIWEGFAFWFFCCCFVFLQHFVGLSPHLTNFFCVNVSQCQYLFLVPLLFSPFVILICFYFSLLMREKGCGFGWVEKKEGCGSRWGKEYIIWEKILFKKKLLFFVDFTLCLLIALTLCPCNLPKPKPN